MGGAESTRAGTAKYDKAKLAPTKAEESVTPTKVPATELGWDAAMTGELPPSREPTLLQEENLEDGCEGVCAVGMEIIDAAEDGELAKLLGVQHSRRVT